MIIALTIRAEAGVYSSEQGLPHPARTTTETRSVRSFVIGSFVEKIENSFVRGECNC
jgi:hypothetical protein